jgi:pimeloyl-ACP methyl ester carboxylesterase
MGSETATDEATGRRFYLDEPDDVDEKETVTFVLNLHGGGSAGVGQRGYFPIHQRADRYDLVVAAPTAATAEPTRHWAREADDDHLRNVVAYVVDRYGADRIRAFWLAGHSQGGITSQRLLTKDPFFADRVDGWLSLSGGRLGQAQMSEHFRPPPLPGTEAASAAMAARRRGPDERPLPECDFSFIYTTGEHEIVALPETSPWAERFGAGPRERQPDIVDTEPGQVWDTRRDGNSTKGWGFEPRPGRAEVWLYPGARDGRVIADVVRIDKGHTEGLEPNVTEYLVQLMVSAPGGKLRRIA